jgi:hypothetical protein
VKPFISLLNADFVANLGFGSKGKRAEQLFLWDIDFMPRFWNRLSSLGEWSDPLSMLKIKLHESQEGYSEPVSLLARLLAVISYSVFPSDTTVTYHEPDPFPRHISQYNFI